jgi:hypothetical protein
MAIKHRYKNLSNRIHKNLVLKGTINNSRAFLSLASFFAD